MSADAPPLPGVLAEIAGVAGREAALALALARGGDTLYVPRPDSIEGRHPLAGAVGLDAARRIAGRYSGETLSVPRARRALVRHLAARGLGAREIAARLGISVSAARRYRRRPVQGTMVP